ncbi:hypothetical protein G4H71_15895 [Rhodococcus triatomae]|uniref:Uncharacterized protein n=1 Tax=Rhodococcus triatomae TaxID=300028 RepID=A0A1G8JAZ9_9NOCA|nr:hypothetical protein [Rhodococcus triatomae]QNG19764.1 hypothetical protein G4H72_14480 [Rhodococcus triatomae]QNG24320.1 hypothetical protein G4H71_15895 [Rhodococcus triatomae]SDI28253.1 hypothetical protein SAMN05444695_106128 [Rhodococcus triatomae]
MVAALKETLLDESRTTEVVADVQALIDAEVSDKSGASGLALKGGYAAVKKVGPSIVPDAIEGLLPAFVEKLEPFWQEFAASGEGSFAQFLTARGETVSHALLGVTDERIEGTDRGAVKKVYSSLRPSAQKHVAEALPRLGDLVQKYAG